MWWVEEAKCYAYDVLIIGALGIKGKFGSQASIAHIAGLSKLYLAGAGEPNLFSRGSKEKAR
jgi:hypothetical protein